MSEPSERDALARDVLAGLSATPKRLSSRYFYDRAGSELFEQIMALPEYYLTRAETRLLREQGPAIARQLSDMAPASAGVDLVELGSGNGEKTLLLCQALQALGRPGTYHPIDLSGAALETLAARFQRELPGADVRPLRGDFDTQWPAPTSGSGGPPRRRVPC